METSVQETRVAIPASLYETSLAPTERVINGNHSIRQPIDDYRQEPCRQFDGSPYASLLEDPVIALWAREAGTRYRMRALDALGLLAHALILDGNR